MFNRNSLEGLYSYYQNTGYGLNAGKTAAHSLFNFNLSAYEGTKFDNLLNDCTFTSVSISSGRDAYTDEHVH